MEKLYLLVKVG